MSNFSKKTVLITGGASGIGFLMAKKAVEKGAANVLICDINEQGLSQSIEQLSQPNTKIYGFRVDVSSVEEVKNLSLRVKKEVGFVDILINNAGIIVGKYFHEHTHSEIDLTLGVNTQALMHFALEFLPEMIEHKSGHIVNIASAAGMVSNPQMSVYCASKWAVIGWSDSLRLEMQKLQTNVRVTTVTPYYINTGMFEGVKSLIPIIKPEKAVKKIIAGIERNKTFIRMPLLIYTLPFVKGLLPTTIFDWVVGKGLGVYKTMEHFKGRK